MYSVFEKLLKEKGITAYKVSKETGVGRSTFTDWKNGRSEPKTEKLGKIADYLGVSVDYLMTGEEKETSLSDQPDLWEKIRHDKELLNALEKYIKLSDRKKKHVIETINVLSEV